MISPSLRYTTFFHAALAKVGSHDAIVGVHHFILRCHEGASSSKVVMEAHDVHTAIVHVCMMRLGGNCQKITSFTVRSP